jgi:hypothetical protein
MKHHRSAEQVKLCNIVADRPGIIKPFMIPAKMKNQVRIGQAKAELKFSPTGKNLVGGVQWAIKMQRPGIADAVIVAKQTAQADAAESLQGWR